MVSYLMCYIIENSTLQLNFHLIKSCFINMQIFSMVSVVSFDGAEENLKRTFERSRVSIKDDVAYPEGEGLSISLFSFVLNSFLLNTLV